MSLSSGSRLGSYEILAPIGAGGMGEVYRARDGKLNRDVALKILPAAVASDVDRVARFRREAQVLASLNHPNIGHIYGFEDTTTPPALVLELVDGATLADRIAQGPVPLVEAVPIARQIADALEAAHEHGVIHRDLKPANVKVREDGTVKVLDFGLAKALDPTPASQPEALNSPTLTARATQMGVVLGTAAYMSPEQAKGKTVDRRADIWAFGVLLYEMLSGKRPFEGEDVSDTLAAVLRQDVNWNALPAATPPALKHLIIRCLERDVRHRLRDIGEARILLEDPAASVTDIRIAGNLATPRELRPPLWKSALVVAAAALGAATIGVAAGWYLKPVPAPTVTRFRVVLPEGVSFTSLARHFLSISLDGTRIVYVANGRLYSRLIGEVDSKPIPGTEETGGPTHPTISPDGRSVIFWAAADLTIKRVAITGGSTVTVCQSENPFGISWTDDGIVVGDLCRFAVRASDQGRSHLQGDRRDASWIPRSRMRRLVGEHVVKAIQHRIHHRRLKLAAHIFIQAPAVRTMGGVDSLTPALHSSILRAIRCRSRPLQPRPGHAAGDERRAFAEVGNLRHSPVVVESAQTLVVNPSVTAWASHFPSGDSAGLTICQIGGRSCNSSVGRQHSEDIDKRRWHV